MKKFSFFAALLLTLGFTACTETDNPVQDGKQIITLDGKNYKADLVGTFTGEIGAEVSLGLGVYENFGIYGVDFGDGVIKTDSVGHENGGVIGDDGLTKEGTTHKGTTKFEGTISGDGIVKVYGIQKLWYIVCEGGICPTSLDQEKLLDVVQVSVTSANVEEIELPEMPYLTQFKFNNSPVKSVDVAKATALTSLTIQNTSLSAYEPQLESIDLSNNTELDYLSLQGNDKISGKLTSIDLSNNTNLTQVFLQYNALTEVKLPADAAIKILNVQNNELETLDLSGVASVKDIYASDNKLKEIDLSKLVAKGTLNLFNNQLTKLIVPVAAKTLDAKNNKIAEIAIDDVTTKLALENNELTFSNLPTLPAGLASKPNKYTYSPQNATVQISLDFGTLDLGVEYGPFQGILGEGNTAGTKATFKSGETEYTEFTQYDNVITFKMVADVLEGELTNDAFPGLTLPTSKFAISTYGTMALEPLFTYDFAAAFAAEENPSNLNGNASKGQEFFVWWNSGATNRNTNQYKGYTWAEGSVLPEECHVWRSNDRINGSIANGGLNFGSDKPIVIDGLDAGNVVQIYYDASKASQKAMVWGAAIADDSSINGATATIKGVYAESMVTNIASGDPILVKTITPEKTTKKGYIVVWGYKGMVVTKIVISKVL